MTDSRDVYVTPCWGRSEPYDILIEKDAGRPDRYALREAQDMCGRCEVRLQCLTANRDERWAQVVFGIADPNRPTKPPTERHNCGTTSGYYAHIRAKEKPCTGCRTAATAVRMRTRRIANLAANGITDELRKFHAEHRRLRSQGVALDAMPADVDEGEAAYQKARHVARKQKKEAAA